MRFTESHEWVRLEGQVAVVGITDYAQKELGEIVFIELPKVGQTLKGGEEACVLESTKAAADIYAPVSGTVLAINETLTIDPSPINHSAESTGWLFQMELLNIQELDRLLTREQYQKVIDR